MPLITCPDCQTEISDAATNCIKCGRPMGSKATVNLEVSSSNINTPVLVGIISLFMVILGTLLPVAFVPIIGGIDYLGQADRDGIIVFGLGIVALLSFLTKRYRVVILIDTLIVLTVSFSLIVLLSVINSTQEGLSGTNLFGVDLSEVLQISIGPALLVIFAGAVINLFISYKLSDLNLSNFSIKSFISNHRKSIIFFTVGIAVIASIPFLFNQYQSFQENKKQEAEFQRKLIKEQEEAANWNLYLQTGERPIERRQKAQNKYPDYAPQCLIVGLSVFDKIERNVKTAVKLDQQKITVATAQTYNVAEPKPFSGYFVSAKFVSPESINGALGVWYVDDIVNPTYLIAADEFTLQQMSPYGSTEWSSRVTNLYDPWDMIQYYGALDCYQYGEPVEAYDFLADEAAKADKQAAEAEKQRVLEESKLTCEVVIPEIYDRIEEMNRGTPGSENWRTPDPHFAFAKPPQAAGVKFKFNADSPIFYFVGIQYETPESAKGKIGIWLTSDWSNNRPTIWTTDYFTASANKFTDWNTLGQNDIYYRPFDTVAYHFTKKCFGN